MNIRFAIKNTQSKAEKEGDVIVRYSGTSEPFRKISERTATARGKDAQGNAILIFTTGLDEQQVKFFKWYSDEEKKVIAEQIKELKPVVAEHYGGDEVISERNSFFWGTNRDVNRLSLTNEDMDVFYDTKNPVHALLYLSIISGAFIDTVAPTRDWAERHQLPHYLVLETEDSYDDEDSILRIDAAGMLNDLRKDANPEALFILGWCIHYDTKAYGAYSKSTPVRDLAKAHMDYIEGKLVTKRKRNTPKVFVEYAEKWKGQQTRPSLYTEAYVKAGQYYSFINEKAKKLETTDGTVLGNTVTEAVENLAKTKFKEDYEKLRKLVEDKWKE